MKPFAYYCEEHNANGELIDKEFNDINQFSAGRFGKPLYTAEQLEAACAKVCEAEHDKSKFGVNGMHCAAAIRARGEK